MNEAERAEEFNRDLDRLLAGEPPVSPSDEAALYLAAAFAKADFSADSPAREEIRLRLVPEGSNFLEAVFSLFSSTYARAAFAAAGLALILLPLARRAPVSRPGAVSVQAPAESAGPAVPATASIKASPLPPPPRAEFSRVSPDKPAPPLFASVPMGELKGEPVGDFPIKHDRVSGRLSLSAGREVEVSNGSGIAWETEDSVFELRRQETSLDELFQINAI